MKVLVIPDVHLKPWIFSQAVKLMKDGAADRAVCLMDIADDWNKEYGQGGRTLKKPNSIIRYENTIPAVFVRRVNRFVAEVLVEGRTETGEI